MNTANSTEFPAACRQWRQLRKLSQLELALEADVSQRHVSWLETGRSSPSRDMVIRLSEAMDIPLRERNRLLQSAGFAAAYRESALADATMGPIMQALKRVLDHHDPLPAVVMDRFWNVLEYNRGAGMMLELVGDIGQAAGDQLNLSLLTLHPQGLRRFITNWEQIGPELVQRLRADARAGGDPEVAAQMEATIALAGETSRPRPSGEILPVLPLEMDVAGIKLGLFSVISTFGTPQDVTTDEIRVEAFYPNDSETMAFFSSLDKEMADQ